MLILGLDFETTGFNIPTIGVTEIGMVMWDTDLHAPLKLFGCVVDPGPSAIWEPGVEKVHGLTQAICDKHGMAEDKALRYVLSWYGEADVACAHNGTAYDRPLLDTWAARHGWDSQPSKVWIDTMTDVEIPGKSSRLTYMAADHEFLNPFPHRAVFDVMTMLKILDKNDLGKVLELAASPTLEVKAIVSFEQKDLARNLGYHAQYSTNLDGTRGRFKHWTASVKACKLEKAREDAKAAGFSIEVIG